VFLLVRTLPFCPGIPRPPSRIARASTQAHGVTLARLITAGVGGLLRLGCYDEHLGEASACAGLAVARQYWGHHSGGPRSAKERLSARTLAYKSRGTAPFFDTAGYGPIMVLQSEQPWFSFRIVMAYPKRAVKGAALVMPGPSRSGQKCRA